MTTWPSGNKAVTTTTDAATDSISGARVDINKTISNVNDIIDIFNIPSSPTDNHILKYNSSTGKFDVEADTGGGSGIALTDLSVSTQSASGNGSLAYNNSTGVFTFTPAATFTSFNSDFDTRLASKDTGDLSEGSNLYYTNARADARIAAASINDLTDVDTTGVANNKILKYNSTTSKFEIADDGGTGSGIALTDLSVTVGSNSQNGGLSYNNSTGVFTHNPVAPTWLDKGTVAQGATITFNYASATVQRAGVTAAAGGANTVIATPTNMEQGAEMTIILEGVGASGQDADITLSITNLKIDTGFSSGFNVNYGQYQVWKIIYDGTNYYMYKANNTTLS
jgi:hypothetical protein